MRFRAGAATDTGQIRGNNQDLFFVGEELFAVADGMGGHNGGEVAAKLAIDGLRLHFTRDTIDDLVKAVERANSSVIAQAKRDPELRGMGTTLCALAAISGEGDDRIGVVSVGDSRIYLLLDEHLYQVTKDHSLVAMLVEEGTLSRTEAEHHPQRNILTRALGIEEKVMVDSFELLPVTGDRYLVCSDGLFNEVDEAEIVATLRHFTNPNEAAHELVLLANAGGGRDNITCVVVDVLDGAPAALDEAPAGRVLVSTTGQHRAIVEVTKLRKRPKRTRPPSDDPPIAPDGDQAVDESVSGDDAPPEIGPRRIEDLPPPPRRMTWRVGLFGALFLAALLVAVFAVGFSARNTFYVGFDGDSVAIFRGRPGGVLWIDPTVAETTDIPRVELPARLVAQLEEGQSEDTLDSAREYVEFLRDEAGLPAAGDTPPDGETPPDGVTRDAPRGITTTTAPADTSPASDAEQ